MIICIYIYIYIYISLYSDWYCQIPNITLYDIVASHAASGPRRTRRTGAAATADRVVCADKKSRVHGKRWILFMWTRAKVCGILKNV